MAETRLQFSIVTPERVVHEDVVDSISVTTSGGEITILPNHIALVCELEPGEVVVRKEKKEEYLAVSTGFVEVLPGNKVVILADSADRVEELDLAAIEAAKAKAEEILAQKSAVDDEQYVRAAAAMKRELAKTRVYRKRR